ncbi:MAG: hypothetical protein IJ740_18970 [Ruminococcus sp.]|nr:hypothetical protein [Ruminococcus sp.]MBR1752925.1 hypothetical protein [Ruminococcus sp.]
MDGGLGSSSEYGTHRGAAAKAVSSSFDYTKTFEDLCPYYMSIGMTYDEYWNGDNYLPRYYLKAYKLKRQQRDEEMWIQGKYIYEGIAALAPLFAMFSKKKKAEPYVQQPYLSDILDNESVKEEKLYKKSVQIMDTMMSEVNAVILSRKGENNG